MTTDSRLSVGVAGLDNVLSGGLLPERSYLLCGGPGTGKTILGLHYLLAGTDAGETALYLSFEEPPENIRANASRLGFDLSGVEFLDLTPSGELFSDTRPYSVFKPDEVESDSVSETITEAVERTEPDRVVLDSINRLEALTADQYQFRRQTIALMKQLTDAGATVLFTTQPTATTPDDEGLDSLLNGGVERGTVTVLSGPTGAGKTTTGTSFAVEAARRGERSALFLFEESTGTFTHRCSGIGLPVAELTEEGTLAVESIEPVTISPDEFASAVREEVETNDTRVVMIDGISGYRLSMRGDEDDIVTELHSLCRYLKNMGVTTVLVDDVAKLTGSADVTSHRISYLADNIVLLRYLEVDGELRKAVGVLKKRASDFERSLRSFEISPDGIQVGEQLSGLKGILSGTPDVTGPRDDE